MQNVLKRLDRSYINFFEGRGRHPKSKKESGYRSFTYPQATAEMIGKNSIILQKIGRIRMIKHRPVKGLMKTVTIVKTKALEWYAVVTTEMRGRKTILEPKNPAGIDLGLDDYIYVSDGTHVDNPRFMKQHGKRILKAQKILGGRVKGSGNRWRANVIFARRWNDYNNAKTDWQWKLARTLTSRFDMIGYEKLRVTNMMKNHKLAKAIQEVAWSGFTTKVAHVASRTGHLIVGVDPRYSTQECPSCHSRMKMSLSERIHACKSCGLVAPRDLSAALIVKQRAIRQLGMDVPEITPMEMRPTPAVAIASAGEPCRGSGKQVPPQQTNLEREDSGAGSVPLAGRRTSPVHSPLNSGSFFERKELIPSEASWVERRRPNPPASKS